MIPKTKTKEKMREGTKEISKKKLRAVEELADLAKSKKTILIASIKNLPDPQFQIIKKKLRGKAVVKIPKKNIIIRAIDSIEKGAIKNLKKQIKEDIALLFSDLDSFELAAILVENKTASKAKAGQEAPEDIEVQEGPTDLVPGPAISELGALGIPIMIQNGKISIKSSKLIVKKGQKISAGTASIMNKLDMKPFKVGFEPVAAFDTQEEKLYLDIKVDKEKTIEELRVAFGRALPLAVEVGYACKDTIKFIISKAGSQEKPLKKLVEKEIEEGKSKEVTNNEDETKDNKAGNNKRVSDDSDLADNKDDKTLKDKEENSQQNKNNQEEK